MNTVPQGATFTRLGLANQDDMHDRDYVPIPLRKKRRRPKPNSQRTIRVQEVAIQDETKTQEKPRDCTISMIGAAPFYHLVKKYGH